MVLKFVFYFYCVKCEIKETKIASFYLNSKVLFNDRLIDSFTF
jgi:hypothetical protein